MKLTDGPPPSAPIPPIRDPFKVMTEAITAAQDLVGQFDPISEHEIAARDRVTIALDRFLALIENRVEGERADAGATALVINLVSHPDPAQAQWDHLVMPLLGIGSVKTTRGLKAWRAKWASGASDAVLREIEAHRRSESGEDSP